MPQGVDRSLLESLIDELRSRCGRPVSDVDIAASSFFVDYEKSPLQTKDNPLKVMLRDKQGKPIAFLICSPPWHPEIVSRNILRGRDAARCVTPRLAASVLLPFEEGTFQGVSWGLYSVKRPISDQAWRFRLQRMALTPVLVKWLVQVVQISQRQVPSGVLQEEIVEPLRALSRDAELSEDIRCAAERGIVRLEQGVWSPRFVMAHNDLWKGNIMLPNGGDRWRLRFYCIDWAGSTCHGWPFYDSMSLACSFTFPDLLTRAVVYRQCDILQCEVIDAGSYLATSLASLRLKLGYWPRERFLDVSKRVWERLAPVLSE